jgi:TRAP-type transport system small permease protein
MATERIGEAPANFSARGREGEPSGEGRIPELTLPGWWQVFDRILVRISGAVVTAVAMIFSVLIALEVLSRYLFDYSIIWIDAAAIFLLVWFFMLGAPLALRLRAHVGLELLLAGLPPRGAKALRLVAETLTFLFFTVMAWSGFRALPSAWRQVDGALQISVGWVMAAIPVGFVLLAYTQAAMFAAGRRAVEGASNR